MNIELIDDCQYVQEYTETVSGAQGKLIVVFELNANACVLFCTFFQSESNLYHKEFLNIFLAFCLPTLFQ